MGFLLDIPDVVWGAVAGAVIAFMGSILNGLFASARQRRDLKHQAEQRELERRHVLRRDIYLPFAEAANKAIAFLPQIASMPLETLLAENPMLRLAAQTARVNLIAPASVLEPTLEVFAQLLKSYMLLMEQRLSILEVEGNLSVIDQKITSESLAHADESGALIDQQTVLAKKKTQLEFALSQCAIEQVALSRKHALSSLIQIRRELGMVTDEPWFTSAFERSFKTVDEALKQFQEKAADKVKHFLDRSLEVKPRGGRRSLD